MKRALSYVGLALLVIAAPALAGQDRDVWSPSDPAVPSDPPAQLVPGPWDGPGTPLYDNGPLVTHPGGGAGGADASALQTALGMTIFGYGHQLTAGNRVADDFTVPAGAGWLVTDIDFFAYQTGSTTTSTINHVNYRIWDGPPPGGTVIFGDTSTNRLTNTTWTNAYRVTDTSLTNSQRPIMVNTVSAGILLPPGTYWLDWQTGGTLASGPWAPPVTVLGSTGTGNGLQSVDGGATYNPVTDVGPQDFPFMIFGLEGNCNAAAASIPDNDPIGVSDTLNVAMPPLNDIITDLDVVVQATHTWVGDLAFSLEHVDTGTTVTFYDRPGVPASTFGCSGDNVNANVNDEGADGNLEDTCLASPPAIAGDLVGGDPPNTSLFTAFDGEPVAGDWTITATDSAGGDTGTLDAWCIVALTDTMPFIDGFESGDTSAWTFVVP